MFARSNLGDGGGIGQIPPPSEARDRLIGALVLIALITLLILAILGADAAIFNPLNASDSATQTYDATHGGTGHGTLPPGHPRILPPTAIPQNANQHVV
jgi:hypothetical protein